MIRLFILKISVTACFYLSVASETGIKIKQLVIESKLDNLRVEFLYQIYRSKSFKYYDLLKF